MRKLFITITALFMSAVMAAPITSEEAQRSASSEFSKIDKFPTYTLSYNKSTVQVLGEVDLPIIGFDIEILLDTPKTENGKKIKRYENTIALDCARDRVFVITGKAFDPDGSPVYMTNSLIELRNKKEATKPVTEIIKYFCPTLLEGYKKRERERGVTRDGGRYT